MLSFQSGSTSNPYRIPLFLWIALILVASTDSFSGHTSSRILAPLLAFLFPGLTPSEIQFWHVVLRKTAHIAGYFVLGFLAARALSIPDRFLRAVRIRAVCLVLAVAVTDEVHQSFSTFRSGSIVDVGYDCLGGFAALALLLRHRDETRTVLSHPLL